MHSVDDLITPFARRQSGVFTAQQAWSAGISKHRLARWTERNEGELVHPATYVAGPCRDGIETRRWASVLAATSDALVGGEAALDDWGLERRPSHAVELIVTRRQRPLDGVKIIQTRTLVGEDRTVLRGRPTTTVERTLVDVADRRTTRQLCKLISEAAFHRILDIDRLRRAWRRNRNRAGAGRLRRAIAMYLDGQNGVDSATEERFVRLLHTAGVVDARSNVCLELFGTEIRVDVYVELVGLVIEFDPDNHLLPDKRREDRLRDALLDAANVPSIRVRESNMYEDLQRVLDEIRRLDHLQSIPYTD